VRPDARDRREDRQEGQGGIPDGLLVGILAFLLGMTVLVWTATGLAALFSKGAWPHAVTFTRTPLAMRHLIGEPHDLTGAWPDTPPSQLSGWGLFWGLFIGQLMILFVLTVFVMGVVARWRAGRARARAHKTMPAAPEQRHEVPLPRTEPQQAEPVPAPQQPGTTTPEPTPQPATARPHPVPQTPLAQLPADNGPVVAGDAVGHGTAGHGAAGHGAMGGWEKIIVAPREARLKAAAQTVRDAEGPALVVT
jgi:hypothetical protein